MDRLSLLQTLWAKVDAFVEKVDARYPGEVTCRAGCSSCCLGGLGVTEVEAEAIREHLALLDPSARAELALRAEAPNDERCVALDESGRCGIYPARPLVCRSHGLPIRFEDPGALRNDAGRRKLPLVDVCPLNFESTPLTAVSADCILDQTTLSTALLQIDATGRPRDMKGSREAGRMSEQRDWAFSDLTAAGKSLRRNAEDDTRDGCAPRKLQTRTA